MICPKCGVDVPDSHSFCTSCGAPLTTQGNVIYATPTASDPVQPATPVMAVQGAPAVPAQPSARRELTTTQKLAVVLLSCVLVALVAGVGVLAYATGSGGQNGEGAPTIEPVAINDKTFPDEKFRNYVAAHYDSDADQTLAPREIAAVKEMDVSDLDVQSLEGIGHFKNLQSLTCVHNEIQHIDVTLNTKLEYIDCRSNPQVNVVLPNSFSLKNVDYDPDANITAADDEGQASQPDEGDQQAAEPENPAPPSAEGTAAAPVPSRQAFMPCESSWMQCYEGAWYSGGVLKDFAWGIALDMEGVKDLGIETTAFAIRDGYVYYVDGNTADQSAADLCRQKLDGDGSDKEVLAQDVISTPKFYLAGEHVYFNAVESEGMKRNGYLCRISVKDGTAEKITGFDRVVGAAGSDVFFIKEGSTDVYRCAADSDLTEAVKMKDLKLPHGLTCIHETADGKLFIVSQAAAGANVTAYDIDGKKAYAVDVKDASSSGPVQPYWSDGTTLYLGSKSAVVPFDLVRGKAGEAIELDVAPVEGDQVAVLFADENALYYRTKATNLPKDGSDPKYSDEKNRVNCFAYRHDMKTGASTQIKSWYEQ